MSVKLEAHYRPVNVKVGEKQVKKSTVETTNKIHGIVDSTTVQNVNIYTTANNPSPYDLDYKTADEVTASVSDAANFVCSGASHAGLCSTAENSSPKIHYPTESISRSMGDLKPPSSNEFETLDILKMILDIYKNSSYVVGMKVVTCQSRLADIIKHLTGATRVEFEESEALSEVTCCKNIELPFQYIKHIYVYDELNNRTNFKYVYNNLYNLITETHNISLTITN